MVTKRLGPVSLPPLTAFFPRRSVWHLQSHSSSPLMGFRKQSPWEVGEEGQVGSPPGRATRGSHVKQEVRGDAVHETKWPRHRAGSEGQSLRKHTDTSFRVTGAACGQQGEQAPQSWFSTEARRSLGSQSPGRGYLQSELLPILSHVCHLEQGAQIEP